MLPGCQLHLIVRLQTDNGKTNRRAPEQGAR